MLSVGASAHGAPIEGMPSTMANKNWVIETRSDAQGGWVEVFVHEARTGALDFLAGKRNTDPLSQHRLVYKEVGCPDAITSE